MEELYTEKVQEILYHSLELAKEKNHHQVDICHLLKVFLNDKNSMLSNVLNKIGVNVNRVNSDVDEYLSSIRKDNTNNEPKMSYDLSLLFSNAKKIANNMKDKYVSSEHLVLALFDCTNTLVKDIIKEFNLNRKQFEDTIKSTKQPLGNKKVSVLA